MKTIYYLLATLILFSCSITKSKISNKEKTQTQSVTDSVVKISQINTVREKRKIAEAKFETIQTIDADVCNGDSLEVTNYNDKGMLVGKTVIKGSGKAKINQSEKSINTITDVSKDNDLKLEKSIELSKKIKENKVLKSAEIQKSKSFMPPWWVWLIVIAGGLYFNYRYNKLNT